MQITQKHQLIDDQSVFRLQELQALHTKSIQNMSKQYTIVSVIGSQSSGKSTLLNALFRTQFDVLNRKLRVGQTTKGIWYSVDLKSHTLILDVEGSDSNERQERTKIQRRNSLFALSISHVLLINLWIQQIGLYRGSQLAILEIILQLNLKLFGAEKPKQIIFVIRDYAQGRQNPQALKKKLFQKVEQAWNQLPKPAHKSHIKLTDVFTLKAVFLPSFIQQKQQFLQQIKSLRAQLEKDVPNRSGSNVSMKDFPLYLENIWDTIKNDKDINLPEQKILLSNMKCHQAKKKAYQACQQQFRDQLQRSQRKLNLDFAHNIKQIQKKILTIYHQQSQGYIESQVQKVREELQEQLDRKIEISFSFQVKHIIEECLKQFNEKVTSLFIKDKNIQAIKALKPEAINKFKNYLSKVSHKNEWIDPEIEKFTEKVQDSFKIQKQKIMFQSLKQFDRSIKKQMQNIVSNAFYDKKIFCTNFWEHISTSLNEVQHKMKNSIIGIYDKLQFRQRQGEGTNNILFENLEKAKLNAEEELKTIIKMKSHDLVNYMMRHFRVDFKLDAEEVPHLWQNFKEQQIKVMYEKSREKYINLIGEFTSYDLHPLSIKKTKSAEKIQRMSSIAHFNNQQQQLLTSVQIMNLKKKLEEQMKQQYEQALKKHKQVYFGAIPKWAWIIFLIVAFDDFLGLLQSPYLLIPIICIVVVIVLIFALGGKTLGMTILNQVKSTITGIVRSLTGGGQNKRQ